MDEAVLLLIECCGIAMVCRWLDCFLWRAGRGGAGNYTGMVVTFC